MSEADQGFGGQPARRQPDSTAEASTPQPAASVRLVILIAEDEEPIADALAMVIEDAGYVPLIAAHGRQAIELYRQHHPALIITDLMMPYVTGEEVIKLVHADAASNGHQAPPIILITAAGSKRIQTLGADAVMRKPFDIIELETLLDRFLGMHNDGAADPQ